METKQLSERREAQWRARAKALIGVARDMQFKETADSIRLAALRSVITPDEMAVFNARIKERTAAIRARLKALASPPCPLEKQP